MKLIAPDYYKSFHCIADKCRHSCCLGWEIDIDADKLLEFQNCSGDIGEKLRANIVLTPDDPDAPAHFQLSEGDERCPFLNNNNLCELILTLGEDSLCQICRDHPRFRNYWSDFTEIGLGMACEEAARIILSKESKMQLIEIEDDGERADEANEVDNIDDIENAGLEYESQGISEIDNDINASTAYFDDEESEETDFWTEEDYLEFRADLFDILQDRSISVDNRIIRMMEYCELDTDVLTFAAGPLNEIACEQLAVYLLYRNYADVLYDDRLEERVSFVAESYCHVRNEWAASGQIDVESLVEPALRFSEEIEYDTDTWK